MKFKTNLKYTILAILLFIVEVLIAVFFKTGFVRHTFGDFLVVILLFCFVKSFINVNAIKLALGVLVFAFIIEFLQLFHILELLNLQHHQLLKLILGSTFHISDLMAYALGILTVIFFELKMYKLWVS